MKNVIANLITGAGAAWNALPPKAQSILRHMLAAAVISVALFDWSQFLVLNLDGIKVTGTALAGAAVGAVWRVVQLELAPFVRDQLLRFANWLA